MNEKTTSSEINEKVPEKMEQSNGTIDLGTAQTDNINPAEQQSSNPQNSYTVPAVGNLSVTHAEPPISYGVNSPVYTADYIINESDFKLTPIIDKLIYEGALHLLIAPPKEGKTTAARSLMTAVVDNTEFLGLAVNGGDVLYLCFDEPYALVKQNLTKVNPANKKNLLVSKLENSVSIIRDIEAIYNNSEIKLVVIDLLTDLSPIKDLNSFGEVKRVMDSVRKLADKTNLAFLMIHHASKSDSKNTLGSQAFDGLVDNIIYITRSGDNDTYIQTKGRFESIEKTKLNFNPENCCLTLNDDSDELSHEEKVLKVVGEHRGLSGNRIAELANKQKKSTQALLKVMEKEHKVTKIGGKYVLPTQEGKEV